MFHPFDNLPNDVRLPEQFTCPFCYTPHPLVRLAAGELMKHIAARTEWQTELQAGKMFGVLVAQNESGQLGYIAAFSGLIAGSGNHSFFVPPIFDYTQPDGHFKQTESQISELNRQIETAQNSQQLTELRRQLAETEAQAEAETAARKSVNQEHKAERERRRKQPLTATELAELTRQSQFEKAELRRLQQFWAAKTDCLKSQISIFEAEIEQLKNCRRLMSEDLQHWLFEQYVVLNARGESKTIGRIFAEERGSVPPAATGECAAPKMLQYAYKHGLRPLAMGEFWWGDSPEGEIRRHGNFYPACHNRCRPLLGFMLQGLDVEPNKLEQNQLQISVIYNDDWLVAVNKPAGLLSVPGKDDSDSALTQLQIIYGETADIQPVHRLDMQTSGVLLFAKDKQTQASMMQLFERRQVNKRYVAVVEGVPAAEQGIVSLPLRLNPDDRPRQIVDFKHGRKAVTRYKVLGGNGKLTVVEFFPETGRTHQLRVHAAHPSGLNCPIIGDNLYGSPADKLYLHAERIEFAHPVTGEKITIESKEDFCGFGLE